MANEMPPLLLLARATTCAAVGPLDGKVEQPASSAQRVSDIPKNAALVFVVFPEIGMIELDRIYHSKSAWPEQLCSGSAYVACGVVRLVSGAGFDQYQCIDRVTSAALGDVRVRRKLP
jgi:hypothetical protein